MVNIMHALWELCALQARHQGHDKIGCKKHWRARVAGMQGSSATLQTALAFCWT